MSGAKTIIQRVCGVVLAFVGAMAAYAALLTHYSDYDDEGYMLISFMHYMKEGHLYTQTFSQYGPFYFYAQGIFYQLLHLPVTHDMGRLVTLVYWVFAGVLGGIFVKALSRSFVTGCAGGLCVTLTGRVLAGEPGHPQQILLVLYLVAACMALPGSWLRYCMLGLVGAALLFTKVNVGVFFVAGLAHSLLCLMPSGKLRSIGLGFMMLYAAGVPWFLMHGSFSHGFGIYCAMATVCTVTTFGFGAFCGDRAKMPWSATFLAGAGLIAGAVAIVSGTLLQGVTIAALLDGVLLGPIRHPNVYFIPLEIGWAQLVVAICLSVALVFVKVCGWTDRVWFDVLCCVVGVGSLVLLCLQYDTTWVVGLLPLGLIRGANFTRLFVTCMAVTQFLEVFPVAGDQRGIAAVPMVIWAFLCLIEGLAGLRGWWPRSLWRSSDGAMTGTFTFASTDAVAVGSELSLGREGDRPALRAGGGDLSLETLMGFVILVGFVGASVWLSDVMEFRSWPAPSRLKGMEWVRMPLDFEGPAEVISRDVAANCDMLFTMPGMASFNLWSGVQTPNGWNLTAWMKGIGQDQQAEILRILKGDPKACVVLDRDMVEFWDEDAAYVASLPLAQFITNQMPKVAEIDDYEIRVNPLRTTRWVASAKSQ